MMHQTVDSAAFVIERRMRDAAKGDAKACFELGTIYSTGTGGVPVDLIQAHKWFNLAAMRGHAESQICRAEIAEEMSAREISEAQKQARAWLGGTVRRAA